MKNKDTFGCTTFRKGKYFGRSYDFYCDDIASSILHTDGVEGVRYESIGMSGSSSNGLIKDKALDGTIEKSTVNTLFSSIVDGINEKGVAISTLVVPKGDKGITTGTNPSKPSISARIVPRIVLDKTYSAKNAIKLLSELNIIQDWNNLEYELHWMIADAKDTYVVETVNNKLSYLGPEAIEEIEDLYSGQLEADVVTNFYQTGFSSASIEGYIEGHVNGIDYQFRAYEVKGLRDNETYVVVGTGNPAEEDYPFELRVRKGNDDFFKNGLSGAFASCSFDPDKNYVVLVNINSIWTTEMMSPSNVIDLSDRLYHEDSDGYGDTPLEGMPSLSEIPKKEEYSTFAMPVTNPTVTPYGAGLERYKIVKDKLAQVNGDLADDKEAMGIINLVQYTGAYKNDTAWYSEFVDHAKNLDNRTLLEVEGEEGATPCISIKLSDVYPNFEEIGREGEDFEVARIYELPSLNTDEDHYDYYDGGWPLVDEKGNYSRVYWSREDQFIQDLPNDLKERLGIDPDKVYYSIFRESPGEKWNSRWDLLEGPIYYEGDYDGDTGRFLPGEPIGFTLIIDSSKQPSDYVKGINSLKEAYNSALSEGGKEAVRALGLSWHSNHQCVYDLDSKTMLVYPSENGEVAYRVDIHGVVENEAVEIGGESSGTPKTVDLSKIWIKVNELENRGIKLYSWVVPVDILDASYSQTSDDLLLAEHSGEFSRAEAPVVLNQVGYYDTISEIVFATPVVHDEEGNMDSSIRVADGIDLSDGYYITIAGFEIDGEMWYLGPEETGPYDIKNFPVELYSVSMDSYPTIIGGEEIVARIKL